MSWRMPVKRIGRPTITYIIVGSSILGVVLILLSFANTDLLVINPISAYNRLGLRGTVILEIGSTDDKGELLKYNTTFGSLTVISPPDINTFSPSFSPDGTKIALVFKKSNEIDYHIGIFDVNKGSITTLIDRDLAGSNINTKTSVAWSSDGNRLLISIVSNDGCFHLAVFKLADLSYRFLDPSFCKSDSGSMVDQVDISWFPGTSALLDVEYERDASEIYLLSESMDDITWIAKGENSAWRPRTKDITYTCRAPLNDFYSLCEYSLDQKSEKYIVEWFPEDDYAWSSDGNLILFVDRGGESDPGYLSIIKIDSGEWILLQKTGEHGGPSYKSLIWALQ